MNDYYANNVTCRDCEWVEMYPVGGVATCRRLLDAIYDELGISVQSIKFDPNQDAGHCEGFDPTEECLERINNPDTLEVENGEWVGI